MRIRIECPPRMLGIDSYESAIDSDIILNLPDDEIEDMAYRIFLQWKKVDADLEEYLE